MWWGGGWGRPDCRLARACVPVSLFASVLFRAVANERNVSLPAYCRMQIGLCKGVANERNVSLLTYCRMQIGLCKAVANERNVSLLTYCRMQIGLCKVSIILLYGQKICAVLAYVRSCFDFINSRIELDFRGIFVRLQRSIACYVTKQTGEYDRKVTLYGGIKTL